MREWKYYQVGFTDDREANGIVIRTRENRLELFSGEESDLKNFGVKYGRGEITYNLDKYFVKRISPFEAEEHKRDRHNWRMRQARLSSGTSSSILANTPGTREYAHRD